MPRSAPLMPAKLAESAYELFAEQGFEAVTIDEIATRTGVTKGSFYSHYRSKREIILAACTHYYRAYHRRVQAELAPLVEPADRLRRATETSVATCVVDRQSRGFTTEIFALSLRDSEVRQGWMQFYDSVREMYVGLMLGLQATGRIEAADPRPAVDLMLAAIEGIKIRAVFEPHLSDPAEQQTIVEGLLRLLTSTPREPRLASARP